VPNHPRKNLKKVNTSKQLFLLMRRSYFHIAFFFIGLISFQCKETDKDEVTQKTLATVTTTQATAWDQFSITIQGNVSSPGNDVIIERGFVYGTTPNANIDSLKVTVPAGVGPFVSKIENLREKTLFYFKAYAKTSRGIAYGLPIGVSTTYGLLPEVELNSLEITRNAADTLSLIAKVTSFGSTPELQRGFIISDKIGTVVTQKDTLKTLVAIIKFSDSLTLNKKIEFKSSITSKSFKKPADSLKQNTIYYVKAFSTNSAGTAYSIESIITTSGLGSVINADFIFRNNILILKANVNSSGNLPILDQGFLLIQDDAVTDANFKFPLDAGNKIIKIKNSKLYKDTFSIKYAGSKMTIGNIYKYRAYSLNIKGYNYAPISKFRYLPIGAEYQNGLIYIVTPNSNAAMTKAWIVAKQDLTASFEYGCLGDTVKGKTSINLGESTKNTTNMIFCTSINAANKCREIPVTSVPENANNWDLPSRNDLQLIYDTIASRGLGNFILSNTNTYWSSSEEKEVLSFAVTFGTTKRANLSVRKNELLKVRAVRAIK